jgi:hypothetical protein
MRRSIGRALGWALVVVAAVAGAPARGQATVDIDREPISYGKTTAADPVARLQRRIDRGEVKLSYDEDAQGYLKAVLDALGVPTESQMLVFSKTSFQHTRIGPRTPRAVYFGDDVYVGYVRGGDVLEVSAVDPKLGATFYLLDQRPTGRPEFVRQSDACLQCHVSTKTQEVPGHLVRSVFPDRSGLPLLSGGSFVTDHTSPLSERWGGWYVTGTHGGQRHMGNVVAADRGHPEDLDREAGANRTDLKGLVDTSPYLTGHSDLVALMVLEHQTQTQNLITAAGYQARLGRYSDEGINKALGRPADALSPSTERRVNSAADKLAAALLLSGEAKLTDPVAGTSGFAAAFPERGPRDRKGRSLRDLDLSTRLFKYPCSYLIYSESFDALPVPVKERVYRRLLDVLTGRDTSPAFAHLSPDDRRAILEILADTRPGLPDEWRSAAAGG